MKQKGNHGLADSELEKMWEEFEDVLFIEAKDFYEDDKDYEDDISLVLASDWHDWEAGTSREAIWSWFDKHYSKGLNGLL